MNKFLSTTFAIFVLTVSTSFAQGEISAELAKSLKNNIHEPNMTSAIFSLFIVICLIYITGIVYTKLNKFGIKTIKKQIKEQDDTHIAILSTAQLGHNKTLHVIEIAGKKLLIGATPNSVNLIDNLTDKNYTKVKSFSLNTSQPEKISENCVLKTDNVDKNTVDEEELGLYKKYLK